MANVEIIASMWLILFGWKFSLLDQSNPGQLLKVEINVFNVKLELITF